MIRKKRSLYNGRTYKRVNRQGNFIPGRQLPAVVARSGKSTSSYTTYNSKRLPSGFTVKQTWWGLDKAWLGYTLSKQELDRDKMIRYASIIQKLQRELYEEGEIPHSSLANFPNLKMYALGEKRDNAAVLYDELVDTPEPEPEEEEQEYEQMQRDWIRDSFNSDGLERVQL